MYKRMDSNNISGLKSLTQKMNQLESVIMSVANTNTNKSTIERLHDDVQAKTKMSTLSSLSKIKSNFEKGLLKEMAGFNITKEITRVVQFAVTFVENNIPTIAKVLGVPITGDLKLSTCVSFIQSVVNNGFNEETLVSIIEHFVELLFPNDSNTVVTPPAPVLSAPVPVAAAVTLPDSDPAKSALKRRKSVSFFASK